MFVQGGAVKRRFLVTCWLYRGGRRVGSWTAVRTIRRRSLESARRAGEVWAAKHPVLLTDGWRTDPGSFAEVTRDGRYVATVEDVENWPSVGTMGVW